MIERGFKRIVLNAFFVLSGLILLAPISFADKEANGQQIMDCIVARAGNEPITLRETIVRASLWRGRIVSASEPNVIKDTIVKLVNQKLIISESRKFSELKLNPAAIERTKKMIIDLIGGKKRLADLLHELNVGRSEFKEIVREETLVREFIKNKFVPFVFVTPDEIQNYYRNEVLKYSFSPEKAPPLSKIESQIRNVIKQEKINKALFNWLSRKKEDVNVEIFYPCNE